MATEKSSIKVWDENLQLRERWRVLIWDLYKENVPAISPAALELQIQVKLKII